MKQVLAIHTNGVTQVNPDLCEHKHHVTIKTGRTYTIAGEATDSEDTFEQCLDCHWVMQGDRTWAPMHEDNDERIPW